MECNMKLACVLLLYYLQLCLPVQSACPANCDTNGGTCEGDKCLCPTGRGGLACVDECHASCVSGACSDAADTACLTCDSCTGPNQFCQSVDNAGTPESACACKTGFDGLTCDLCDTTHWGESCQYGICGANNCHPVGGTGSCLSTDANKCDCVSGYNGADCSAFTCTTTDVCGNGGTCNSGSCDCAVNTAGAGCQYACTACATGKVCTEKADKTGAECTDGGSSLLVTWAVLVLGVWSATKLY